MANVRNEKGQFVKGMTPHNKKWNEPCSVDGCNRTDMKALGLCQKHYKLKQSREKKGVFNSDLSKRLPRTQEHIDKQRLQRIGKPTSLKGKTYEEIYGDMANEIRKKHSESLMGVGVGIPSPLKGIKTGRSPWNKGKSHCAKDKNYFWRGGSSYEKYGHEFTGVLKEKVRNRDNRMCVCCGCPELELETKLCVHHIDENKNNNKEDNLISLCRSCHTKVHWSKGEWADYMRSLIKNMEVLNG